MHDQKIIWDFFIVLDGIAKITGIRTGKNSYRNELPVSVPPSLASTKATAASNNMNNNNSPCFLFPTGSKTDLFPPPLAAQLSHNRTGEDFASGGEAADWVNKRLAIIIFFLQGQTFHDNWFA